MRLPTKGWRYKRLSASHYVPQQQGTIRCLDPYSNLTKTFIVCTMNGMGKIIRWALEKDVWLKANPERGGVGFEECAVLIEAGQILDSIDNPSVNHSDQKAFVLETDSYAYLVPYVETDEEIFLKTVYPSRKFTVIYLDKENI